MNQAQIDHDIEYATKQCSKCDYQYDADVCPRCNEDGGSERTPGPWTCEGREHVSEIYIIFDGPPSHESGRFVEVEDKEGHGLGPEQTGADWKQRDDGLWALGPFVKSDAAEALKAIAGSAAEQLAFLHKRGLQAKDTRYAFGERAQQPEAYELAGEHEADARGQWPALVSLIDQVAKAALAEAPA